MTALPFVNIDLGESAPSLGAAERLPSGNLHFTSGNINQSTEAVEALPDGTPDYVISADVGTYRPFRSRDRYSPE